MEYEIQELPKENFPPLLLEIPDQPKRLRFRGQLPAPESTLLCIVGSRKYTPYGKEACEALVASLAGSGVTIVSGLALGIDAIAHEAALRAGLPTVAVPGSGLSWEAIYPKTNFQVAKEILSQGGALLSEFADDHHPRPESFPQRNRIMAGMSHATLIIEAEERSGTLITARLAMDYNRDVCVVPAGIFSDSSKGSNRLLREGAHPITDPEDLLEILGIKKDPEKKGDQLQLFEGASDEERAVWQILDEPKEKEEVLRALSLSITQANILLSSMEIKGMIRESMGKLRRVEK
ncbi:MAG TPA: DNA-processing protein DprA [Candidatus Paceibacterota bacterium]|nr:DNA-processing protein DprA [Candidatus Paceibacterota bacterium]